MSDRDYIAEMRALIDEKCNVDQYVAGMLAQKLVAELEEKDPELLQGWLHMNAAQLLRDTINSIDRSRRAHTHLTSKRSAFHKAATAVAETGDTGPIQEFLTVRYVVDNADTRKKLADMVVDDLLFVAENYESTAKRSAMHAVFMRQLAIKVGDDKVADHFDDAALTRMWNSLGR